MQHENLPAHVKLPDSDMLKAIHWHVAKFYAAKAAEAEEKAARTRPGGRSGRTEASRGAGRGNQAKASLLRRKEPTPERGTKREGADKNYSNRTMDGTALLAMGILLEEAAAEALGKRGHIVLTEGLTQDAGGHEIAVGIEDGVFWKVKRRRRRRRRRLAQISKEQGEVGNQGTSSARETQKSETADETGFGTDIEMKDS